MAEGTKYNSVVEHVLTNPSTPPIKITVIKEKQPGLVVHTCNPNT
jgi:hypothetical protein